MANRKITEFDNLVTLANGDVFPVVDVSDPTHASSGTTKNVLFSQLVINLEGSVNHDSLVGFVANEHIDHSSVSITPNTGLIGGGNLTASRTISMDISTLTDDASPSGTDEIAIDTGAGMRKSDLTTAVDNAGATMNTDTNVGGNSWVLQNADSDAADDTKVGSWTKTINYVSAQIAGGVYPAYRDLAQHDIIKLVNDNGTTKYDKMVGVGTPVEQTGSYVSTSGRIAGYKLDDTRIAMAEAVSGNTYYVWDIANNAISSFLSGANSVSGASTERCHVVAVDTDKFVHLNWSATTSGADTTEVSAKAVTLGTGTSVTAGSSTNLESDVASLSNTAHGVNTLWVDKAATNKFIAVYKNQSNGMRAVAATVSGTAITVGTPITLGGIASLAGASVVAIDTDRAVAARHDLGDIKLDMLTLSGTTITDNGETTVTTTIGNEIQPGMCKIANDKFALVTTNASSTTEVTIFSVSGTTITEEDSVSLTSTETLEARCYMSYDVLIVEQGNSQWLFSVANDTLTELASTTSLTYGGFDYNNKVILDEVPYTVQSIDGATDTLRAVPQMIDYQFATGIIDAAASSGDNVVPSLSATGLSNIVTGGIYYPANNGNGVDTNAAHLGVDKVRKFQGASTTSVTKVI